MYLLRPCSPNKTFFWNLPGPLPTSAVTNEQYACFTVLNWPSGNLHKEMLGAVGVGWGRGSRNCNAEELGAKLSLALKEKFAQFPANHAENIPQETQFNRFNLICTGPLCLIKTVYKKQKTVRKELLSSSVFGVHSYFISAVRAGRKQPIL